MKVPTIAFAIAIAHGVPISAAVAETLGPLPSGKPAGIHQAQQSPDQAALIFGAAVLVGIGIALATSSNNNSPTTTIYSPDELEAMAQVMEAEQPPAPSRESHSSAHQLLREWHRRYTVALGMTCVPTNWSLGHLKICGCAPEACVPFRSSIRGGTKNAGQSAGPA